MPDVAADYPELEAEGLRVMAAEQIPSDVANIGPAVERVMGVLRTQEQRLECEYDVDLALREALTNAMIHGNNHDPTKLVQVMVVTDESGGLHMIVRDAGQGFDPSSLPDPVGDGRIRATHGRGVFLMRKLLKDVDYRNGGREVRMRVV